MEKTTRNIIYLCKNIEQAVLDCKENINEEKCMVIETKFVPQLGETFDITIQQSRFLDKNMYRLKDFVALDEDALLQGIIKYYPDPAKVAPIIDDWFKWNK